MRKKILIISLIFFFYGCNDKKISTTSCNIPIKCQNFLKHLDIQHLEYQGCKKIEAVPFGFFEAIYLVKEENIFQVEKELINKVNMEKFTNLTAVQLSTTISRAFFYIEDINVSLFVNFKNNPLGALHGLSSNHTKDYEIRARVYPSVSTSSQDTIKDNE